jgi:hypothetical protein
MSEARITYLHLVGVVVVASLGVHLQAPHPGNLAETVQLQAGTEVEHLLAVVVEETAVHVGSSLRAMSTGVQVLAWDRVHVAGVACPFPDEACPQGGAYEVDGVVALHYLGCLDYVV